MIIPYHTAPKILFICTQGSKEQSENVSDNETSVKVVCKMSDSSQKIPIPENQKLGQNTGLLPVSEIQNMMDSLYSIHDFNSQQNLCNCKNRA